MSERDYSTGYTATIDGAEIRDGSELVRGDGMPTEWFEGDSLRVDLPSGERVLFIALPDQGQDLFSWSIGPHGPVRLARLERVSGTMVRVHLVQSIP